LEIKHAKNQYDYLRQSLLALKEIAWEADDFWIIACTLFTHHFSQAPQGVNQLVIAKQNSFIIITIYIWICTMYNTKSYRIVFVCMQITEYDFVCETNRFYILYNEHSFINFTNVQVLNSKYIFETLHIQKQPF